MAPASTSTDSNAPRFDSDQTEPARYASDPMPGDVDFVPASLGLSPVDYGLPVEERSGEALRVAIEAFNLAPHWIVFYREFLGDEGICRKLFPEPEQMRYFETTIAFRDIQEMIASMRGLDDSKAGAVEPERVITIRIPATVHDAMKIEASQLHLSINKLCLTKLLQRLDPRHVPLQKGAIPGRKPGPQKRVSKNSEEPEIKMVRVTRPASIVPPVVREPRSGDWSDR